MRRVAGEKLKNDFSDVTVRGRNWIGFGIALAVIGVGLFLLGVTVGMRLNREAQPAPSAVISQTFSIKAHDGWQSTGLVVNQNDVITVSYQSGQWRMVPSDIFYGPDGDSSYICATDCVAPLSGYPSGALIGRIGGEAPFPVGSEYQELASSSGALQLRMNDAGIEDNEGIVNVLISIKRMNT